MKNGLYGENTCDSCNDGFGIATEVDSAYVKRFDQNMFAFDLSINFNERQNGLKTEKGGEGESMECKYVLVTLTMAVVHDMTIAAMDFPMASSSMYSSLRRALNNGY